MIQILVGLAIASIIDTAYLVCFTAEGGLGSDELFGGVLPFLILSIGPFLGLAAGWWLKAQEEEVDEDE